MSSNYLVDCVRAELLAVSAGTDPQYDNMPVVIHTFRLNLPDSPRPTNIVITKAAAIRLRDDLTYLLETAPCLQ